MARVYIPRIVNQEAVNYPDGSNDFSLSVHSDELLRWQFVSRRLLLFAFKWGDEFGKPDSLPIYAFN
jgi:hypothetical protein